MTAAMHRILIVEDDAAIRSLLRTLLEAEHHRVTEAENAERARVELRAGRPDLVLVDLGLPDRDGHFVIREVRKVSAVPILVLSARTLDAEKIQALDEGADDYVTKPFSSPELLARVRAALRRALRSVEASESMKVGKLEVNLVTREAEGPDGRVHLTPLEFRLLESLARRAGMIVTHAVLIREVWGENASGDSRNLRVYITSLRQKIEPDPAHPRYLVTEIGIGYRLLREERDPAPTA